MRAELYTKNVLTQTFNPKGMEVLLQVQRIVSRWFHASHACLTLSTILATALFLWCIDPITIAYERLIPPPFPPAGEMMRVYRAVQHVLSIAAIVALAALFKILFWYLYLDRIKKETQAELSNLLRENPGFLSAIQYVSHDMYNEITPLLPQREMEFLT